MKTSVWDGIKDYPNQHLCNVNGTLQCNACSEFISNKKSSIGKHVKSKKLEKGLSDIAKNKLASQTIMECLKGRDQKEHARGSTLPTETRLFCFEVVESVLSGGIALAKLDALRPVLEKYGHRLTSCPHMFQIIPAVLEKETCKLKEELKDVKETSFIFDGTARLGEALIIIIRDVQENFVPTQHLICLEILAKAMKGEELAQKLLTCLAGEHNFGSSAIVGGMSDGASINGAALRQLLFFYPKLFDVVCFSHTLSFRSWIYLPAIGRACLFIASMQD